MAEGISVSVENQVKCSICFSEFLGGLNDPTIKEKLRFCVPKKSWSKEVYLCDKCILELEVSYNFLKRCFNSEKQVLARSKKKLKYFYFPKLNYYNCLHCPKKFKNPHNLFRHNIRQHNANNPFDCLFCKRSFKTYLSKIEHEKRHLTSPESRGILLSKSVKFKRKNILSGIKKEKGDIFEVTDASDSTRDNESFMSGLEQIKIIEPLKIFVKEENDEQNSTVNSKLISRKEIKSNSLACDICKAVFATKYLVRRHITNVHVAEKNFKCDICGRKFKSSINLNEHKLYHTRKRSYICTKCGKAFITSSDLCHHEKIHDNKRQYKCEDCPKDFKTSSDLYKHKICVHVDRNLWKYECVVCSRKFPSKNNLDYHVKIHTGERNFPCHLCDKKYISRSNLLKHVNSHTNERKFICSECGMHYKYEKSLKIHLKKVHNLGDVEVPIRVKKFFCHLCPKSFFDNYKLQTHLRTHTGEKPFSCHLCNKNFSSSPYVKQHLKIVHNLMK